MALLSPPQIRTSKNKAFEGWVLPSNMSSRLNMTFFAALAIQMLMIGATAAPLVDGLNPMGDYEKMDKSLRDSLSSSSEDEVILDSFSLLVLNN